METENDMQDVYISILGDRFQNFEKNIEGLIKDVEESFLFITVMVTIKVNHNESRRISIILEEHFGSREGQEVPNGNIVWMFIQKGMGNRCEICKVYAELSHSDIGIFETNHMLVGLIDGSSHLRGIHITVRARDQKERTCWIFRRCS